MRNVTSSANDNCSYVLGPNLSRVHNNRNIAYTVSKCRPIKIFNERFVLNGLSLIINISFIALKKIATNKKASKTKPHWYFSFFYIPILTKCQPIKEMTCILKGRSKILKTTGPTYTWFQIDPIFLLFQKYTCYNKFNKFINILYNFDVCFIMTEPYSNCT